MAPLVLACSLVPHDNATAVPNSAQYGTSSVTIPTSTSTDNVANRENSDLRVRRRLYKINSRIDALGDRDDGDKLEEGAGTEEDYNFQSARNGKTQTGSVSSRSTELEDVFEDSRTPQSGGEGRDSSSENSSTDADCASRNRVKSSRSTANRPSGNTSRRREVDGARSEDFSNWHERRDIGDLEEDRIGVSRGEGLVNEQDKGNVEREEDDKRKVPPEPFPVESILENTYSMAGSDGAAAKGAQLTADLMQVIDRPVFCLVVLGAAASAAVTASMSTFGTGIVTSLELLKTETAAAATFGGIICAAGVLGTPAGGALIDSADPEGRLGDEKKLAIVLTQGFWLVTTSTGTKTSCPSCHSYPWHDSFESV